MPAIRAHLFNGSDPYTGFDAAKHPVDIQGWNSSHHFFSPIISAIRPSLILEIGSWKGASAINMAKICKTLGLETEIVCIDTWLGSAEHIIIAEYRKSLRHLNGFPQIYYTFMANVIDQECQESITPFPIASASAAIVLTKLGIKADLIYVDADHEYDAVYRDATAFWPLLSDDGVMIFDDYGYSDVTRAVCAFAAAQGKALYASYGKAFIVKGSLKPILAIHRF